MRVLNDLLLDTVTVAMTQNSNIQPLDHIMVADLTATILGANPANKTFTTVDQSTDLAAVTAHGFTTGMLFRLTTTGGLPTGLLTATDYYAIVPDADHLGFATSQANALAGTKIDLTGAGTGTQTVVVTTALAGTIKLQKNNEPSTLPPIWFDIASSSQAFAAAGKLNWALTDIGYKDLMGVVTTTSGTVTVALRINAKGV